MPVKVSVIMPVYNGEDYLELSISSILSQTLLNFEMIILDDASTDSSWEIIQQYVEKDKRIRPLRNSSNQGLITTLNSLLEAATGELIARQDHDDISAPNRLEKQVAFMDTHPDVGLLGTAFHQIDMAGNHLVTTYQPETDTQIRWKILFANPFAHTSVMFRRKLVIENDLRYSYAFPHSEDYELWIRFLQYTRAANLAIPLVSWRRNIKGLSQTYTYEQNNNWKELAAMQLNRLLPEPISVDETMPFFCLYTHRPPCKEELAILKKAPQILHAFAKQPMVINDADGLRKNRQAMISGLLESLFNGLSLYGYYGTLGVYSLLFRLFWLDPPNVLSFVVRKGINFFKRFIVT